MELTGITQATTDATNLLGQTAFQVGTNKGGQADQVRPSQSEGETDSVKISPQARELSQSTIDKKPITKK